MWCYKKKVFIVVFIFIFLISLFTNIVYGRDNFAFSVGSRFDRIDTRKDMQCARNAYAKAGLRSYGTIDPNVGELWENLYADVQFFAAHGNTKNVQFTNSGIIVGDGWIYYGKQYIGTNKINWDYDTMLVTYASCNSAGENGQLDTNSIAYRTALKGADIAVGFKNKINTYSATNWGKRYNEALGNGLGVIDAVNYANKFIYLDNKVKENHIIYHGNANLKIGKYNTRAGIMKNNKYKLYFNRKEINLENDEMKDLYSDKNILKNTKSIITNNEDNIFKEIKKIYSNFNKENYEIKKPVGVMLTNLNTGKTIEDDKYIDLQLKIGDFYTNAGYSIRVKDGIVKAIYDNNIDMVKQEKALLEKDLFKVNMSNIDLKALKEKANEEIKKKYITKDLKIKENVSNDDISFYYDINTDKKYICINILSEVGEGEMLGKAYDIVKYEL